MNKILLCFAMSCFLINPAWAAAQPSAQPDKPVKPLNRIVAVVNDEIISQTELDATIDQFKQQLIANKAPVPPTDKLRDEALQQLINYRLQIQMATRYEIKPTDEEVKKAIEQIAKNYHMTVAQLQQQLILQNTPYDQFHKKIYEQLMIAKLQQQMVAGQTKVTDADIAVFKASEQGEEEYRLVDFFLPLSENPTKAELDRALTTAHKIHQQLNSGMDVDKITPAYQDLGWRTTDNLPQIFIQQLRKLTLENASQPIHAPNGYHVLKLLEKRNQSQTLTDAQIHEIVLRQKYEAAVKSAVDKARAQAYIAIIPQ